MKKALTISIIVILIMLLSIGGVFAYLYFGTDIFKGDKELFFKYMGQNLDTVKEIFIDQDVIEYGKRQKTQSYTSEGEFKQNNTLTDSSITFIGETDKTNNYLYRKFTVNTSETEKISAEYLQNDDKYGVKLENITPKFVVVENKNLKQWAKKLDIDQEYLEFIPDSIDFDGLLNKKIFTDEEEKQLKDKYFKVLADNLKDDMFSKSEADGSKVYTLTLTETQMEAIYKEFLKTLKDDELIWNKVKDLIVEYGKVNETKAMEYINQAKKEIDDEINKENNSSWSSGLDKNLYETEKDNQENTLKINVFVKSKKAVKTEMFLSETEKINIINNNNEMKISFLEEEREEGYVTFKKEKQNNVIKYTINAGEDGNDIMNLAINFDGINSEEAKESYELTVNNSTESLNYSYQNTKKFTQNIEKKELNANNSLVLNGHTLEQITNVLGPVITKAMQSNNFKNAMSAITENVAAVIPLGLVSTLQNPNSLPIIYLGTGASVMMVAVQNSIVSNVKTVMPDKNITNIEINESNETTTNPLKAQEMEAFNSKFKAYEGKNKSASEIRALYSVVKSNNAVNTSRQITIDGKSGTEFPIPMLSDYAKYTVKLTYTNGYVTGITTSEANSTTTNIQESTNNLLTQAEDAKLKTIKAEAQENVKLAISSIYAEMLKSDPTAAFDLTGKEDKILAEIKELGATQSTSNPNRIVYINNGYAVEVMLNTNNTDIILVGEPMAVAN